MCALRLKTGRTITEGDRLILAERRHLLSCGSNHDSSSLAAFDRQVRILNVGALKRVLCPLVGPGTYRQGNPGTVGICPAAERARDGLG